MRITYDSLSNMSYVYFKEDVKVYGTVEQGDFFIDWDENGEVIGIEYMGKLTYIEWDYNLKRYIDKDKDIERLKAELELGADLLAHEEGERERAEHEWGVYVKMSETMALRIVELENENKKVTKELEILKKKIN